MCGSLRLKSGERVKFGGDLYVKVSGHKVKAPWTGFARVENLGTTWRDAGYLGTAEARSYEEHGREFPVAGGVTVLLLTRPRYKHDAGEALVVTREARTTAERAVHPRHPVTV